VRHENLKSWTGKLQFPIWERASVNDELLVASIGRGMLDKTDPKVWRSENLVTIECIDSVYFVVDFVLQWTHCNMNPQICWIDATASCAMTQSLFTLMLLLLLLLLFIYLNQTTYGSINTQNKHMQTRKHTHTHNSKIANYTNTQRMITCTSLLEQDDSLLTNVDFALCITVL